MLKKNLKVIEFFVIWCSLILTGICFIYFLHGEGIRLLKIDIQHGFEDNLRVLWREIVPFIFVITLFWGACLKKRRARLFTVRIAIKEKVIIFGICFLKIFDHYLEYIMLVAVLITIIIVGAGLKKEGKETVCLDTKTIIHAMGSINGQAYTNSLEAFEQHYANGERYFETDFSMTKDQELVARHDWQGGVQEGIDEENIPTEEEFLKAPLFGKYTPLSLKHIISLMQQYEDVYIITDTKDMEPGLARKEISALVDTAVKMDALEVVDRFAVQIYSKEMYEAIKDIYEFPIYIFTLYAIWTGDEKEFIDYCRFCRINNISAITMWDYRCADNPKLCQKAKDYGIAVYVHTVND